MIKVWYYNSENLENRGRTNISVWHVSEAPGDILFAARVFASFIQKKSKWINQFVFKLQKKLDYCCTPGYDGYCRKLKLYAADFFFHEENQ